MLRLYSSLALSYRRWHYRVTPSGMEHMDPAAGFAAIGVMNLFSVMMLLPLKAIPPWLFASTPVVCGVILYWRICKLYDTDPVPATSARYSDHVPGFGQFPALYSYMLATVTLFGACLYVAIRVAA